jgi:hypothetical protein
MASLPYGLLAGGTSLISYSFAQVDPRDPGRHPDVGEDLALHPFQLVELVDRPTIVGDVEPLLLAEARRVEDSQLSGAVAHPEVAAVLGQRPAFAGIGPAAFLAEVGAVPAEAGPALPGEADDVRAPIDDPLAEIFGRDRDGAEHLAILQPDLADRRLAVQAGALVELAVEEEETLGERHRIVRIFLHDPVGIDRDLARRRGGAGGEGGQRQEGEGANHGRFMVRRS